MPAFIEHQHEPLYRVVRAGWQDPLDTSYGRARGGRWNAPGSYDVLYTACSRRVARFVALDIFRVAAVTLEDLLPAARPALAEIGWRGRVVEAITERGLEAAGLPHHYPKGTGHETTQALATTWHADGAEGIVCRSASVARAGLDEWAEPHEPWSELAVFIENATGQPALLRLSSRLDWLLPDPGSRQAPDRKEGDDDG